MILTKLEELRGDKAENKELKRRRWIWELIQNANDCSNGKPIDISIDTDDNSVVFHIMEVALLTRILLI